MVKDSARVRKRNVAIAGEARPKKRARGRPPPDSDVEGELLAVACREFLEHGYGNTSMARIVRAAGVSKTTLYSRFPTKEDLFEALMTSTYLQVRPPARLHKDKEIALEDGLVDYGDNALAISLSDWWSGLDRLIFSESVRFPELSLAAHKRIWLGIDVLAEFIAACARRDKIPCRDPRSVAQTYMLALRGYHGDVNFSRRAVSAEERLAFVRRTVEVLMEGRKGW